MTTADRFREIDNLAAEARRIVGLGRDDPTSRSARGHIEGVQILARDGLRDALANQPKLEAYPVLLAACKQLTCDIDCVGHPGESSVDRIRTAIAKAPKQTAPDARGT